MDRIGSTYKAQVRIATYQGDFTAEQIASGEAGEPTSIEDGPEQWYETAADGTSVAITDPARILDLEERNARKQV